MTKLQFSKYQKSIFEELQNGNGNIVINAVAGSGKTTTLLKCFDKIPANKNAIFLAFNKAIAEYINKKSGIAIARTIHSIGFRALQRAFGKPKLNNRKYSSIIKNIFSYEAYNPAISIIDKLRLNNLEPTTLNIMEIANRYSILEVLYDEFIMSEVINGAGMALKEGIEKTKNNCEIDFTDMIYMPVLLKCRFDKFDYIFIDECQDITKLHIEIIKKMCKKDTRIIAVGDPQQAIYGFAGAMNNSFEVVKKSFNAKEMPLSVCYRCPKKVIDLANKYVPNIEPRPFAPEGKINFENSASFILDKMDDTSLVLSRKTAPLMKLLFELYAAGKKAHVKGREIGAQIISQIKKIASYESFIPSNFENEIRKFFGEKINKALASDDQQSAEILQDQMESIIVLYRNSNASSFDEFYTEIKNLFKDKDNSITLSTIHKAKGLEADKVFIINFSDMPMKWKGQNDWQYKQELNLIYVAITRTKKELYIIN